PSVRKTEIRRVNPGGCLNRAPPDLVSLVQEGGSMRLRDDLATTVGVPATTTLPTPSSAPRPKPGVLGDRSRGRGESGKGARPFEGVSRAVDSQKPPRAAVPATWKLHRRLRVFSAAIRYTRWADERGNATTRTVEACFPHSVPHKGPRRARPL